jgi:hypothetical protein
MFVRLAVNTLGAHGDLMARPLPGHEGRGTGEILRALGRASAHVRSANTRGHVAPPVRVSHKVMCNDGAASPDHSRGSLAAAECAQDRGDSGDFSVRV